MHENVTKYLETSPNLTSSRILGRVLFDNFFSSNNFYSLSDLAILCEDFHSANKVKILL